MDIKEAIRFLKKYTGDEVYTCKCITSHNMAISALEKQVEMELKYFRQDEGIFECPNCKEMIYGENIKDHIYCLNCGQKLDWSEL